MRFGVIGAGALGGVIAARLHEAGHPVSLLARGANYAAIKERGLRVEDPQGVRSVKLPVTDSSDHLGLRDGDVVILAVKSQDSGVALDALRAKVGSRIRVVCAQNGVDNERQALRRYENVYGVCAMCLVSHTAPGSVTAHAGPITGVLDIGCFPSGVDAAATECARLFSLAGFSSEARADVMRWKYGKLLLNLGNAVEAACGPAARNGPLGALVRREGERCLQAAGIVYTSAAEDAARRGDLVTPMLPRQGGSTWQSLQRNTGSVETDYLNGEIVLLGRLHGIPTPANQVMQELTNEMAVKHEAPSAYQEHDVLDMISMRS